LKNGLPGALVTVLILGVHELGHYIIAKDCGVKLGVPYFIPSWQVRHAMDGNYKMLLAHFLNAARTIIDIGISQNIFIYVVELIG
jgi:hypothetical protein